MKCPACKEGDTGVCDSRNRPSKNKIWRRRYCMNCHHRFTTIEMSEDALVQLLTDGVDNKLELIEALGRAHKELSGTLRLLSGAGK